MAMQSEIPYADADAQQPSDEPSTRARARRPAAVPTRPDPDAEAMRLMLKVVERVEVARSFAKIAAGIFTVSAARAAQQLRVVADSKMSEVVEREGGLKTHYGRVRKIAHAAAAAAVHVATHRPEKQAEESAEESA